MDESGGNPIAKWLFEIPRDAEAAIQGRLLLMEGLTTWQPKWHTKLTDGDGLVELRIPHNKVQYRPLGCFLPGRTFVLLCGTIEKNDEIPKRHIDTASRRMKQLIKDNSRVTPHEF